MDMIITNAQVLFRGQFVPAVIAIQSGKIAEVYDRDDFPISVPRLDAGGGFVAPGLVEIQINGAFGEDFTRDPHTIWSVGKRLGRYGVTSFLPTIITSPLDTIHTAQDVLLNGRPQDYHGAEPLGLHVEGPFLNPGKKGAHNPAHLQKPDSRLVADWSPETGIRLVTLAPELDDDFRTIHALRDAGVVVSAGHSMAGYEIAVRSFEAGVSCGTHLFNAQPTMDHRAPGLSAALMTYPGMHFGIIADGIHVHPAMVAMAWKTNPQGLILVTDAMGALGNPPGTYLLGEFSVKVTDESARLADGTLAGSILAPDAAVRNLMTFSGCSRAQALEAFSLHPAELLGLERKGRIEPGCDADLVILSEEGTVCQTLVGGDVIYSQDGDKA